ncbi:MAG: hypothetical protein WEE64_02755 [Dehalococcoidia bacterium]
MCAQSAWHAQARTCLDRALDHGVSKDIYIVDTDGIEIEITYDVPPDRWPKGDAFASTRPLVFAN